ncbi:hypothetical protein MUN53_08605 [Parabacteroides sp. AGMB00274]|uniref:Uncharacterized protein n=1 Tax=Parabacteroides faecalis TaxID=2924040 RepID=A0ABT0C0W5_9BACT|nr:hypothetical protein [Parabacteroides faecalis]MCJ2380667.1 hypothetical protein [Parabacteroides faecalis]
METKEIKTKKTVLKSDTKTVVKKKVNKTIEAARKLKGSLIVNDPAFLL